MCLLSVLLIAVSVGVVISSEAPYRFNGILRYSVCIHLGYTPSIYDSTAAYTYGFVFFLTAHLSILRSRWPYVDIASNPEPMWKLAAKKGQLTLSRPGFSSIYLFFSQTQTHTTYVTHSYTYIRRFGHTYRGNERNIFLTVVQRKEASWRGGRPYTQIFTHICGIPKTTQTQSLIWCLSIMQRCMVHFIN